CGGSPWHNRIGCKPPNAAPGGVSARGAVRPDKRWREAHARGTALSGGDRPGDPPHRGSDRSDAGGYGRKVVRLALPASLAVTWLILQLGAFERAHRDIELQLVTTTRLLDLRRDQIDIAIRHGKGEWPGLDCTFLLDEMAFPVCAPGPAILPRRKVRTRTRRFAAPGSSSTRALRRSGKSGAAPVGCRRSTRRTRSPLRAGGGAAARGAGSGSGDRPDATHR